ncbi:MAG: hypothetical protein M5U19_03230 [Microthrixaceae bacterium]|nr:hypothetical protein [Microthrixaceae bacterium]
MPDLSSRVPRSVSRPRVPGLHRDGSFAEFVAVPTTTLVSIPDGVSMAAAAVATDCVASPYHALACRARLQPGERVVVIGAGGLGTMAVVLARILGAEKVVAVDRSPQRSIAPDHSARTCVWPFPKAPTRCR